MSTLRWVGGAQSVKDVWTLTLSGTVTSQTYTITIGTKTLTYTAGGSDTVAIILTALLNAWNSTTSPAPAEFKEYTATGGVTSLVLTANVSGKPGTIAFATGGSASPVSTNTVPASGPNFFNVGANWSGGVAPANSDTVVFDSGSVACRYGLSTVLTGVIVQVNPGYSGTIGLPDLNTDGNSYHEYRTTKLTLDGGTLVVNSPGITRCNVAFGSTLATVRILQVGQRVDANTPVVLVTGGAASSECDVTRGDIGLAFFAGETANFPTIKMSYVNNQASDAKVYGGVGLTVTTITKTGGTLVLNSNVTTLTQGPDGGDTTIQAGTVGTLNANGGTVAYNSTGTLTTLNLHNDAAVTFDSDPRAVTVTNAITMTGPACSIRDNQKRINSGVLTLTLTDVDLGQIEHGSSNGAVIT